MAKRSGENTCRVAGEIRQCLAALSQGSLAASERISSTATRFGEYLLASGEAKRLAEATPAMATSFVNARLVSGLRPSVATMHDRRTALRLLFRVARREGLVAGDPTLDIVLPPRTCSSARPLTDDEVLLARDVSLWSLSSTRAAAAWALAEATGRGAELAAVGPDDLDLDSARVWLHGGARTEPRWGTLTDWGVMALRRRLVELDGPGLVYAGAGKGIAGQVSTCQAISTVLVRAGLAGEPDVRPSSVAAWAGRRCFDETGDITRVAQLLGVRSLDQAARIIGWDWTC